MNISQHCFMPLCQYEVSAEVLNVSGSVVSSSTINKHTKYGDSFQFLDGDWFNCGQSFELKYASNAYMIRFSVLQLPVDESYGGPVRYSDNFGDYLESGVIYKGLTYNGSIQGRKYVSFNFKSGDYQSKVLFWKENLPASVLSLGNSLSPDVIEDEEEMI